MIADPLWSLCFLQPLEYMGKIKVQVRALCVCLTLGEVHTGQEQDMLSKGLFCLEEVDSMGK